MLTHFFIAAPRLPQKSNGSGAHGAATNMAALAPGPATHKHGTHVAQVVTRRQDEECQCNHVTSPSNWLVTQVNT